MNRLKDRLGLLIVSIIIFSLFLGTFMIADGNYWIIGGGFFLMVIVVHFLDKTFRFSSQR
ncbi:hypothetical protein N9R79_06170 [Vibrio sp.]|nr:hypothetical protein [Vibrio sp.]